MLDNNKYVYFITYKSVCYEVYYEGSQLWTLTNDEGYYTPSLSYKISKDKLIRMMKEIAPIREWFIKNNLKGD